MKKYLVIQNDAQTCTTFCASEDATPDDYVAYDGSKKKVVKVIEARTWEIANAVYDAWREQEEQDRAHNAGCHDGEPCWCQ